MTPPTIGPTALCAFLAELNVEVGAVVALVALPEVLDVDPDSATRTFEVGADMPI